MFKYISKVWAKKPYVRTKKGKNFKATNNYKKGQKKQNIK